MRTRNRKQPMPTDRRRCLHQAAITPVLATPDLAQRFNAAGAAARCMDAAALSSCEQAETRKWGEAVAYSGARAD